MARDNMKYLMRLQEYCVAFVLLSAEPTTECCMCVSEIAFTLCALHIESSSIRLGLTICTTCFFVSGQRE